MDKREVARKLRPDLFSDNEYVALKAARPFAVEHARADYLDALEAIFTALGIQGGGPNKVVPRESTEAMELAGDDLISAACIDCNGQCEIAENIYRAMLEASDA